jgi:hypothetical protein
MWVAVRGKLCPCHLCNVPGQNVSRNTKSSWIHQLCLKNLILKTGLCFQKLLNQRPGNYFHKECQDIQECVLAGSDNRTAPWLLSAHLLCNSAWTDIMKNNIWDLVHHIQHAVIPFRKEIPASWFNSSHWIAKMSTEYYVNSSVEKDYKKTWLNWRISVLFQKPCMPRTWLQLFCS